MNQNKLPADPLSLILGIISLILAITGCCCYGITAIIPLIIAIVGLVSANKSLNEFDVNPEPYLPYSRNNVYTGKILNIIGIVLSGLTFLISIAFFALYGTIVSSTILDEMKRRDFKNDDYYYEDSEFKNDSINTREEDNYYIEKDSLDNYENSILKTENDSIN